MNNTIDFVFLLPSW